MTSDYLQLLRIHVQMCLYPPPLNPTLTAAVINLIQQHKCLQYLLSVVRCPHCCSLLLFLVVKEHKLYHSLSISFPLSRPLTLTHTHTHTLSTVIPFLVFDALALSLALPLTITVLFQQLHLSQIRNTSHSVFHPATILSFL